MVKKSIIICAGGIGNRMKSELPKQFLILSKKKSILQISIEKFYSFDKYCQIIVSLPSEWIDYWQNLCKKNNFKTPHLIVEGGKERYHSIKNALKYCTGDIIAVHDSVRPLISNDLLTRCFNDIKNKKAIIPVLPLKDSIRKLKKDGSKTVNRKDFVLVQTPQVFESSILKQAYNLRYSSNITDDASLVEKLNVKIHFCEGDEKNIKITTPDDLHFAILNYK